MSGSNLSERICHCLIAFVGFVLISLQSHAQTKAYDGALILPWSFIQKVINPTQGTNGQSQNLEISQNIQQYTIQAQGIPVVIPEIQIKSQVHFKDVSSVKNTSQWQTDYLAIQVNVSGFTVQKDFVQNLGGAQITVHLRADCSPFTLTQTAASSFMNWSWTVVDGNVSGQLSNFNLSWPASSWQVSTIQCQGPVGFADLIQQELQTNLNQAAPFVQTIHDIVQSKLNDQLQSYLGQLKKPQWLAQDKEVSMQVIGSGVAIDKGLLLRVLFKFGDINAAVDMSQVKAFEIKDAYLTNVSSDPVLLIAQDSIKEIVKIKSVWPQFKVNLSSLSGFQELLQSRFFQFFIWPDLWNYSKSAQFDMVVNVGSAPKLQFYDDHYAQIQAPLKSTILSYRDNKTWDYIKINTNMTSWLRFDIADGLFTTTLVAPQAPSSAKFGSLYVQNYNPSTRFSISTMQSSVEEALNQKQNNFTMPLFSWGDRLTLKAISLEQLDSSAFMIQWQNTTH